MDMPILDTIRAHYASLETRAQEMLAGAERETRDLNPVERVEYDATLDEMRQAKERIAELEQTQTRTAAVAAHPALHHTDRLADDPWAGPPPSNATEARSRADGALKRMNVPTETGDHIARLLDRQDEFCQRFVVGSDPAYERAFLKLLQNPTLGHHRWTAEETEAWQRTSMAVGTNANGGYLVPTQLDPTIMLNNTGSSNILRSIARVVNLTEGSIWSGVTSAGVTASWDGELVEVSDDTPTVGRASIATTRAQAFVQYSVEAEQDIAGLGADLARLLQDAKDRLEGAAYATGSGTGQPKGVFTAVHAVTASRVTSTTAATIGEVDIHATYRGVPQRWRGRGTWLANPLYTLAVKRLGTAVSSSFSGILSDPTTDRILGRPVVETDDAPTTQTTTALDDEILYGDFSEFVIVDRAGMRIEMIPNMLNTANNLPDGRRGLYAWWRTGSDVTNTDAFRVLVDKTSA